MDPVPNYLKQFVARQNYDSYTAIDHAGWRYIMRISRAFFKKHAHPKYLEGLTATGITTDRIPRISEMDEKLKRFGWRAAAVTGFIPPAVFLEFLSLGILPIACDMRRLKHLDYTPSPDIVHEAAGHAPILADHNFAAYLRKFGEISRKAIFAKEDVDVYEAILHLSTIKEDTRTTPKEIELAYERLDQAQKSVSYTSEASQLARLGWWTAEYGLIQSGGEYLIYGAGLLSSVGESYDCFSDSVRKVPLSFDCVKVNYDITKPQPQLFVIRDFAELETVIDELAATMAFKVGGIKALEKAKQARTVTTTVLDSGLQISSVLSQVRLDSRGEISFVKYEGPTQLSVNDVELPGQGAAYHKHGFSSPLGEVAGLGKDASQLVEEDLAQLGITTHTSGTLKFTSGITLKGRLGQLLRRNGRTLVIGFENCTVENAGDGEVLYKPEWGPFDMACGSKVVSVFGGAADRANYAMQTEAYGAAARAQLSTLSDDQLDLVPLYAAVRNIRDGGLMGAGERSGLRRISERLTADFPDDWLLRMEILELLHPDIDSDLQVRLRAELSRIAKSHPNQATLIRRGLDLLPERHVRH